MLREIQPIYTHIKSVRNSINYECNQGNGKLRIAQVPRKAAEDLFNMYVRILTRETVLLHNAKTLDQATQICRQKALAASVSADVPKLVQARMRINNFTPRFGRSFSGRPGGFRRGWRLFSNAGSFQWKQVRYGPTNHSVGVQATSPSVPPVTGSHKHQPFGRGSGRGYCRERGYAPRGRRGRGGAQSNWSR